MGYIAHLLGEPDVVADANAISRWERGVVSPSLFYMRLLCLAFDLSPQDLGFPARPSLVRDFERSRERLRTICLSQRTTSPSETGHPDREEQVPSQPFSPRAEKAKSLRHGLMAAFSQSRDALRDTTATHQALGDAGGQAVQGSSHRGGGGGGGAAVAEEEEETIGDFLAALSPEEVDDLRTRARYRRFARGATIVYEGEIPRRVVVLVSGRVKVSDFSPDGREIILGACGPGDLIGDVSAIDGRPCSATVTALEPVEAMVIEAADFTAFLDDHPPVLRVLLRSVVQKLRDSDRKRVEFGIYDTEGRVARRLVELAGEYGHELSGRVSITLSLTQHELAGWTCSSREAVSKALGNLRACGWVETDRRRVTILNLDALRRRGGF
jgi:CRP/FNR family transcriptional regulator, cyclic AMP receptor protein